MRRARRAANLLRLKEASPNVELTVDELVLHGFPASERYAIGDAFQQELVRLFAGAGPRAFRQDANRPRLDAGRVALPAQPRAATVGTRVARAVYDSLDSTGREGE